MHALPGNSQLRRVVCACGGLSSAPDRAAGYPDSATVGAGVIRAHRALCGRGRCLDGVGAARRLGGVRSGLPGPPPLRNWNARCLTVAARRTPHPAQAPHAVVRSNSVWRREPIWSNTAAGRPTGRLHAQRTRTSAPRWRRQTVSCEHVHSARRDERAVVRPAQRGSGGGRTHSLGRRAGRSAAARLLRSTVLTPPFGSRWPAWIDADRSPPDAEPRGVGVRRSAVGAQATHTPMAQQRRTSRPASVAPGPVDGRRPPPSRAERRGKKVRPQRGRRAGNAITPIT
jgi:hypothetical protein